MGQEEGDFIFVSGRFLIGAELIVFQWRGYRQTPEGYIFRVGSRYVEARLPIVFGDIHQ
jgi:hypothetical protein